MFTDKQIVVVAAYLAAQMVKSGNVPVPKTSEERIELMERAGTGFVQYLVNIGQFDPIDQIDSQDKTNMKPN